LMMPGYAARILVRIVSLCLHRWNPFLSMIVAPVGMCATRFRCKHIHRAMLAAQNSRGARYPSIALAGGPVCEPRRSARRAVPPPPCVNHKTAPPRRSCRRAGAGVGPGLQTRPRRCGSSHLFRPATLQAWRHPHPFRRVARYNPPNFTKPCKKDEIS